MTVSVPAVAHHVTTSDHDRVAFSGEVWTDARGYATVVLPRASGRVYASFDYELRPFPHGVTAHIAAELSDGRFTIATDEPHVKVAWSVTAQRPENDCQPSEGHREEK